MEFTIERAELARLMTHAVRAVESRNTIPILSMVRLDAALALTVTATDLTICATATGAADVATPGSACVEAKLLADITKKAGASEMHLALADGWLTVKSGRSKFKLATLPAEDFPSLGAESYDAEFEADLGALLAPVSFAISADDARYFLQGVFMHSLDGKITAVATDGHRLAAHYLESDETFPDIILPRKTVALLPKGVVKFCVSASKVKISSDCLEITSKLIDGTFPDYRRVIPVGSGKVVSFDRDALLAASDRVASISSERGRAVKFSVAPGGISLAVRSEAGDATDEIEAEYSAEPIEIGLNASYVRDMLSVLPNGDVTFSLSDSGSPVLVKTACNENWTGVCMPMRV